MVLSGQGFRNQNNSNQTTKWGKVLLKQSAPVVGTAGKPRTNSEVLRTDRELSAKQQPPSPSVWGVLQKWQLRRAAPAAPKGPSRRGATTTTLQAHSYRSSLQSRVRLTALFTVPAGYGFIVLFPLSYSNCACT